MSDRKERIHPTAHEVEAWLKHEMEHLGFMMIALEKGNNPEKIQGYSNSLNNLENEIKNKMAMTDIPEYCKKDLDSCLAKLEILKEKWNLLKNGCPQTEVKTQESVPQVSEEQHQLEQHHSEQQVTQEGGKKKGKKNKSKSKSKSKAKKTKKMSGGKKAKKVSTQKKRKASSAKKTKKVAKK